ncbi:uncharacterized protein UMAG_11934 [Mycosarcoma maydis]|uniref:Uncharacterized protein n=1 Tax=Mycosarcoma maydis TaxID=5270 RepID=A0A0D1DXR1_MYCMD|nr:uncharacterized protein UMAG_11934 [Ustilago maydis 521]KIS68929.1 hypothetical protein UMAG_11934 [Ustilago maydis 521]|eukprot:XP_011389561.1 hypothetical protein UMAG_11934 [Ustilago maydis 521]
MNLNHNKYDPHGVQRLLEILRRQQDTNSNAISTPVIAAPTSETRSSTLPHPYASNPFSLASSSSSPLGSRIHAIDVESEAAQRRRNYNAPSANYGVSALSDERFDPYALNPFSASDAVISKRALAVASALPNAKPAVAASAEARDLASLSFAEALPILSTLSTDSSALTRIRTLRKQQHQLEHRLSKEYRQFSATADKQFPNAKARRAQDEKRRIAMLHQWDECVRKQQDELKKAGIPAVKVTTEKREMDKQRKVLNVLVEMLDDAETEDRNG